MLSSSAFAPRKKNAPRPAWKVALAFGQWLRGRRCACGGVNPGCGGIMNAAHVDGAGKGTPDAKGMQTKAADRWQIPLSALCHRLQHDKGWPWFIANILKGRDPIALAAEYWTAWLKTPSGKKWTADNG